jgi:hypothetical protein
VHEKNAFIGDLLTYCIPLIREPEMIDQRAKVPGPRRIGEAGGRL